MWRGFRYDNAGFKKDTEGDRLVVSGEITNTSGKKYNAVVFRLILFIKDIPISNTVITIHGFRSGQTKRFEKRAGDLEYSRVAKEISRYEIYPESGY